MVDESTRKTLSGIPLLQTRAGPRDKDIWVQRLKEEYQALIKVRSLWSLVVDNILTTHHKLYKIIKSLLELHFLFCAYFRNSSNIYYIIRECF